jgi:hypothetical protein
MTMTEYQDGSCVVCGQGTDTAIGTRGVAEWHLAFLTTLGLADDEAREAHRRWTGRDPGRVPGGVYTVLTRVCVRCFAKTPMYPQARPALYVEGGELPVIQEPTS